MTKKILSSKQVALIWAPLLAVVLSIVQRLPTAGAFCNCAGPMSMMKWAKQGGSGLSSIYAPGLATSVYGPQVAHPGERNSWYAQSAQQLGGPAAAFAYGQPSPMKRFSLFQPKWRAGSLFGPKRWMGTDWRGMGMPPFATNSAYKPSAYNYAYGLGSPVAPDFAQAQPLSPGYSYPTQNNEYNLSNSGLTTPPRSPPASNPLNYSPQLNINDGWSAITPNQLPPFSNSQLLQQQQQLYDNNNSNSLLNYPLDNYSSPNRLVQPGGGGGRQSSAINSNTSSNNKNYGTKGSSGSKQSSYGPQKYGKAARR